MLSSPNYHQRGVDDRRNQSGLLTFNLSEDIHDLTKHLHGAERKIEIAVSRSLKKVANWLRVHTAKELGKELNIKQSVLKRRFRLETGGNKNEARLWIGLLAIAAHDLGTVTQNAAGVKVGRHQFDGAFHQRIYEGSESVYIRASRNKVMQHDVVRLNKRNDGQYDHAFMAENSGRFPVQVVGIAIAEQAERILISYEKRLNEQYRRILQQELNYAINIEQT